MPVLGRVGRDQHDLLPLEVDTLVSVPTQDCAEQQAQLDFPGWSTPHEEIVIPARAAVPSSAIGPHWGNWGDQPTFFPPRVDSRNATASQLNAEEAARLNYPGWGLQPNFLPPGVNRWTATAAQRMRNAEQAALSDWEADQVPIRIQVLAYEARGRKIQQALQQTTVWGLTKPPPQGAIKGCAKPKAKPLFDCSEGVMRQEGSAPAH